MNKVYKAERSSVETMELKGYELVAELFVDSSGFGAPDEPALTASQFDRELTSLLNTHGTLHAKITGAGQFQVYVGLFKKTRKSVVNRISTNVTERIMEDGTRVIRLYDTDILKIKGNEYQIFNGGFQTRTTSKWINTYLPANACVYQKSWDWYIRTGAKELPFQEGMTVTL